MPLQRRHSEWLNKDTSAVHDGTMTLPDAALGTTILPTVLAILGNAFAR
jgi:hypothetical protein